MIDMTRGKPFKLIIRVALPLMLSGAMQLAYSFCDALIVSELLGERAFAAVGASSGVNWFPLSMLIGASQGFGVALAHRFGAGDAAGFRRAVVMSAYVALIAGAALSIIGVALSDMLLNALSTPRAFFDMAGEYLRILWAGLALMALYNALASALRSMGDAKTPLIALAISTFTNIILDYIFIKRFSMGVGGAAAATISAQGLACALCVNKLRRLRFGKADFSIDKPTVKALVKMGAPPSLSNGVIAAGGLIVLKAINAQGDNFVIGITAARRYFELMNLFGSALEGAIAIFVAQNTGAKAVARVKSGVKTALLTGGAAALITSAAVILLSPQLIGAFVGGEYAEARAVGVIALRIEAGCLIALYMLCMCRAAAQSMGNALAPALCGFAELAARLLCAFAAAITLTKSILYFTNAAGWLIGAALAAHILLRETRKLRE